MRLQVTDSNRLGPPSVALLSAALVPAAEQQRREYFLLNDNPLVGPCSRSRTRHAELRARHLQDPSSFSRQRTSDLEVWAPRSWPALVQLWQLAHARGANEARLAVRFFGKPAKRLHLAWDPPAASDEEQSAVLMGQDLRKVPRAVLVTPDRLALWAELWQSFCSTVPQRFLSRCESSSRAAPEAAGIALLYAGFFPRVVDGTLALSRFDSLLLSLLDEEWATPARVYTRAMRSASALVHWLSRIGDAFVGERLEQLATSPHGLADMRANHADTQERPMTARSFRRIDRAASALGELDHVPEVKIGGASAYAKPWACDYGNTGKPRFVRRG